MNSRYTMKYVVFEYLLYFNIHEMKSFIRRDLSCLVSSFLNIKTLVFYVYLRPKIEFLDCLVVDSAKIHLGSRWAPTYSKATSESFLEHFVFSRWEGNLPCMGFICRLLCFFQVKLLSVAEFLFQLYLDLI